jgi:hypothetical protein
VTTDLATRPNGRTPAPDVIEQVVAAGDLARLSPEARTAYYLRVCESLGLNPLTKPFEYLSLNGKLVLYARRDATDQMRALHGVSIAITGRETTAGVYVVTARATTPDGRSDESIGAVPVDGLRGEALANALMKAETKAKRRVTLAVVGLGWLDETEADAVPGARRVDVDHDTGEIAGPPPAALPEPSTVAKDDRPDLMRARRLYATCKRVGLPVEPPAATDTATLVAWAADWDNRLAIHMEQTADPQDAEWAHAAAEASQDQEAERVAAAVETLEEARYTGHRSGEVATMQKKLEAAGIGYTLPPSWQDPTFVDHWLSESHSRLHAASPNSPRTVPRR